MRTKLVNERYLLCGGILSLKHLQVGQVWAPASGANYEVVITKIVDDWITYSGPIQPEHTKDCFSFQCRYCLVLPDDTVPVDFA